MVCLSIDSDLDIQCLTVAVIVPLIAGSALIKCGQAQQKLGQAERDYLQSSANNFLQPLKAFLDGDMKTVQVGKLRYHSVLIHCKFLQKERKILETKRLDLDAAKTKLRRAKSQSNKESVRSICNRLACNISV
jgi:endophilin-B